jgi:hypothetical protein
MRLIDIVADKLANTNLMEMAFQRREVENRITDLANPLVVHLIKILVFPKSAYKDHWIKEVNNWLRTINKFKLKPKNKRPTYAQYNEWIIEKWELYNQIPTILKELKTDYPSEKILLPNRLREDLLTIMHSICKDLAKDELKYIKEYF